MAVSEMDKVTQANAANAEESASASSTVMGVVNDLVQIVEGDTGSDAQSSSSGSGLSQSDNTFHQIASSSQRQTQRTPVKATAEKAIPLDDSDDFKEFNA
jgi:methyl-accepting chemotaxis protein